MAASGACVLSRKTWIIRSKAPFSTPIGVLTITAPSVPPSTMNAAVICEMSLILPPSINNPPTIPPNASASPAMVARSGREPPALAVPGLTVFSVFGFSTLAGSAISALCHFVLGQHFGYRLGAHHLRLIAAQDQPPKRNHSINHLVGGFPHHTFLAAGHGNHRVRRDLDVLNQIGI